MPADHSDTDNLKIAHVADLNQTPSPVDVPKPPRAIIRYHRCRVCGKRLSPHGICPYILEHRQDSAAKRRMQMGLEGGHSGPEVSRFVAARIPLQFQGAGPLEEETLTSEEVDGLMDSLGSVIIKAPSEDSSIASSSEEHSRPSTGTLVEHVVEEATAEVNTPNDAPQRNIVTTLLNVTPVEPTTKSRKEFNQWLTDQDRPSLVTYGPEIPDIAERESKALTTLINKFDTIVEVGSGNSPVPPSLDDHIGIGPPLNLQYGMQSIHLPRLALDRKAEKALEVKSHNT